jgi:hypothetical protein
MVGIIAGAEEAFMRLSNFALENTPIAQICLG